VSVTVSPERLEQARATMLELFPEGFEEAESGDDVELAAYTDPAGEERLWHAFGGAQATDVERGWEDRWRSFHRPVTIGPVWIGPPWETVPTSGPAVVVDPGRAFGTGSHATTRLCVELLLDLPRGSLLDVGSGSGVLVIAAAKLGFGPLHAVDLDPLSIEATERNADANGVDVEVKLSDCVRDPLPETDTVVANISLDVVGEVAEKVRCERLVTSGYLLSDSLAPTRFRPVRRIGDDGWAADLWEAATK
jgi:ribosomal protein L11 methyltransferase